MIGALLRCFGSSTFLSGLVSLALTLLAPKLGGEVPTPLAAAIPLAVAWKEGKRRESEGEVAARQVDLAADRIRLEHSGYVREIEDELIELREKRNTENALGGNLP